MASWLEEVAFGRLMESSLGLRGDHVTYFEQVSKVIFEFKVLETSGLIKV